MLQSRIKGDTKKLLPVMADFTGYNAGRFQVQKGRFRKLCPNSEKASDFTVKGQAPK
jgi:hypothetical protein